MLGTLKNMPVVKRTFNRTHCIQGHRGRVLKGFDIISRFRYALRKSPIHMKRVSALPGACSDSVRGRGGKCVLSSPLSRSIFGLGLSL